MENKFTAHSREVVNEFIQNIVFVDDRAYSAEKVAQDFNTSKVLSIFANEGKLCSVYSINNRWQRQFFQGPEQG